MIEANQKEETAKIYTQLQQFNHYEVLEFGLQFGSAWKFQKYLNQVLLHMDFVVDKVEVCKLIDMFKQHKQQATQLYLEVCATVQEMRSQVYYQSKLMAIQDSNQVKNKLREKYCKMYSKIYVNEFQFEEFDELVEQNNKLKEI